MTQHQRIALISMLAGMGFVLHALFFEWSTDWGPIGTGSLFTPLLCDSGDYDCWRIWYDITATQNPLLSIIIGIVCPLVMLCSAIFMALGIYITKSESIAELDTKKDWH